MQRINSFTRPVMRKGAVIGAVCGVIALIVIIAAASNSTTIPNERRQGSDQKTQTVGELQGTQNPGSSSSNGQTVSEVQPIQGVSKAEIEAMSQNNPLIKGIISGEIRFYIDPLPSYADPDAATVVDKFATFLDGYGITGLKFVRVYDSNNADLNISWIKNWGGHTQGLTIFKSIIQVGVGRESCHGEWHPFDAQSVMEILYHEFGHSMGFKHSTDPNNIMYPYTDTRLTADFDKSITFNRGYTWHIQFCGSGTYNYQISTDDKYNGFDVYVAPPNTDYNGMVSGQEPYYLECSTQNMISFSHTCTVAAGSTLWIHNHNDNPSNSAAGQVDVKIVDMNQRKLPDMSFNQQDLVYDEKTLEDIWKMFH